MLPISFLCTGAGKFCRMVNSVHWIRRVIWRYGHAEVLHKQILKKKISICIHFIVALFFLYVIDLLRIPDLILKLYVFKVLSNVWIIWAPVLHDGRFQLEKKKLELLYISSWKYLYINFPILYNKTKFKQDYSEYTTQISEGIFYEQHLEKTDDHDLCRFH